MWSNGYGSDQGWYAPAVALSRPHSIGYIPMPALLCQVEISPQPAVRQLGKTLLRRSPNLPESSIGRCQRLLPLQSTQSVWPIIPCPLAARFPAMILVLLGTLEMVALSSTVSTCDLDDGKPFIDGRRYRKSKNLVSGRQRRLEHIANQNPATFARARGRGSRNAAASSRPRNLRERNWPKPKMSARARSILICRSGRSPQRNCFNGSKNRVKPI
jgi:hypothetical protein